MIYEVYIFRFEKLTSILEFKGITQALNLCDTYNSKEYQLNGFGAAWRAEPRKEKINATVRTGKTLDNGR